MAAVRSLPHSQRRVSAGWIAQTVRARVTAGHLWGFEAEPR